MDNERIYIVEFRSLGDSSPSREIITATSIPQLFDYYINMTDLVEFAFEDVTDTPIEKIEKRMMYNGKYAL